MKVLVTGGSGFIGSHVVEKALAEGASVRVIDNLSTGREDNLDSVRGRIEFMRADLLDDEARNRSVEGVDVVFHEAAVPSVPRSVANPIESHFNGVHATLLLLDSARRSGVKRIVFAASSAAYGESEVLPKREDMVPETVSPYAATKVSCEYYLQAFARRYEIDAVSLRYFNVFGPRQDPSSPYSGVIARFCRAFVNGDPITIFGDGEQSRDFTYVSNVAEANWLAARHAGRLNGVVLNVGCGEMITLNGMLRDLNDLTGKRRTAVYEPDRPGDVRHSLADLSRARDLIGYHPVTSFKDGLRRTLEWYRVAR